MLVNVPLQELLEFTRGLNFAKYIRDAEIQAMIDQVKKRIFEIEGQPELDEGFDDGNGHGEGRATDWNHDNEAKLEVCIGIIRCEIRVVLEAFLFHTLFRNERYSSFRDAL